MQILAGIGSAESTPTPTLSSSGDLGSIVTTITNYDSAATYYVSTDVGSVSRSGATITVSGLNNSQSATVSVYATKPGFNNSATATSSASAIPGCTYTGSGANQIAGGNCSTCGIIPCATGVPAYEFCTNYYTPSTCNLNGTKITTGSYSYVCVGWYCLTTGTGSGLSCGPGSNCCSYFGGAACN
jgi:hypothetical protein